MSAVPATLKPRKSPVQTRSAATMETLHVAAIQVLIGEGLSRCTTTRIAERAGMSVGSLYQYYPNRDALLAAVLERHLEGIAAAVELTCRTLRGEPASRMASAIAIAFLAAKLRDPEKSKALYAVAEGRGGAELVDRLRARMVAAVASLLVSAPDARFDDPVMTSTIVFSAMMGPIRTLLEGQAPPGFEACLEGQLIRLLTAYLQTFQSSPLRQTNATAAA